MTETVYEVVDGNLVPKQEGKTMTEPVPKKTDSPKRKPMQRWTPEEVALLTEFVANASTKQEGFAAAAKQLKKKPGAVQQKWYLMQQSKPKRVPRKATATVPAKQSGIPRASSGITSVDVRSMESSDLVQLATAIHSEIQNRRAALDKASALFA